MPGAEAASIEGDTGREILEEHCVYRDAAMGRAGMWGPVLEFRKCL